MGRAEAGVMVNGPGEMLKTILFDPEFVFALKIAWRSDPVPLSLVFDTVYVAAIIWVTWSEKRQQMSE
jgi:hypothetical protein